MESLQQILKHLIDNGFVTTVRGKYVFTAKFNKEIIGKDTGTVMVAGKPAVKTPGLGLITSDWRGRYIQFIKDCNVPPRAYNSQGQMYDLNKYSEDAMKVFKHAIEKEGIVYEILVGCTALYYRGATEYKKSISSYITGGDWRSDYIAMSESLADGTTDEHIKQHLDNGDTTRFRIG